MFHFLNILLGTSSNKISTKKNRHDLYFIKTLYWNHKYVIILLSLFIEKNPVSFSPNLLQVKGISKFQIPYLRMPHIDILIHNLKINNAEMFKD
jgi:hypothetical protein